MKIKSILFVLLTLLIFVVAIKLVNSSVDATTEGIKAEEVNHSDAKPEGKETQLITVSGENNPALISDRVAYTMVFRLLSSHKNLAELTRLRGFVKQNLGITDNNEIEALFRLADDFKQRTMPIDSQISFIKQRYHPNHLLLSNDDQQQLNKLKKDKEKIVDDLAAEMPRRMGQNGNNKFYHGIQEHVKQKIRIQN